MSTDFNEIWGKNILNCSKLSFYCLSKDFYSNFTRFEALALKVKAVIVAKERVVAFTEELTSSADLKVAPSRAPLFTRQLDILEVIEGRTARFDCKVSGSPAPRVTWMHFGKNLRRRV